MSGTAKGTLLTAGIAFMSAGSTLLLTEKWWIGAIVATIGAAFIFLREFLKEQ
jgi:hypothetical protein